MLKRHWYKPSYWRWWWGTRSIDAKAPILFCALGLFAAAGYLAVAALPSGGAANGRTITVGRIVYRTIAGGVETLPARTEYTTVTEPGRVVTVVVHGKPVTAAITRDATVVMPVTVNQRRLVTTQRLVTRVVVRQKTVTAQQTVYAAARTVTNESTVTQPVTEVSTTTSTAAVTTTVPVTVTTSLPGSTVTRTVTVTTPGPTTTVVALPTMTITFALGG